MASYISSNNNRHYVNVESGFGVVPAVTAAQRFLASSVQVKQEHMEPKRRDKTGSRSVAAIRGELRARRRFR